MDRRLSPLAIALALALATGCGVRRKTAQAPRNDGSARAPAAPGAPATPRAQTRRAGVVTRPLSVTASVPLRAAAATAPAAATPPAQIQDVLFATARDGWLVSAGTGDPLSGGTGALYRTTDGGRHWVQTYAGW